jgi:short subunit dehydrogenase-like uncharacterized protein
MPESHGEHGAGRWLIYGASGYTGGLLAEEAVRRGHRPVLAGRSAEKLRPLADRLGLEARVLDLGDARALAQGLADVDLVLHAAGPFVDTSDPMLRACLSTRTHYLDITGEIAVFRGTYARHAAARAAGIVLMSGVGFDVVPTDCLALHVASHLPDIVSLEIAIAGIDAVTPGTAKSMLDGAGAGVVTRRDGVLQPRPFGRGGKRVRFADRERLVLPIPWGDLESAFRSTGVPNIVTYMAFPQPVVAALGLAWPALALGAPLLKVMLGQRRVRASLGGLIDRTIPGPSADQRRRGRAQVWVRGTSRDGETRDAWLETADGYTFTARAGVRSVERVLAEQPVGALTPAQAFGADHVLGIEGTRRLDSLR